ncbi:hypothetical protein CGCFRS4_v006666 [Colletotrichum fructicola]|nr:hypothetical protein CGCFRS4_v006666 [Colletotrichum fructicola]KAF4942713.1 hypothetical protein CGCF245_v000412 [Colletotrichum fructicola]
MTADKPRTVPPKQPYWLYHSTSSSCGLQQLSPTFPHRSVVPDAPCPGRSSGFSHFWKLALEAGCLHCTALHCIATSNSKSGASGVSTLDSN